MSALQAVVPPGSDLCYVVSGLQPEKHRIEWRCKALLTNGILFEGGRQIGFFYHHFYAPCIFIGTKEIASLCFRWPVNNTAV